MKYETITIAAHNKDLLREIDALANDLDEKGREVVSIYAIPTATGIDGPGTAGQWFRIPTIAITHRAKR